MAREWGNLLSASPREGMALGIAVVLILGFGLLVNPIDAISVLIVGSLAYAAYCLVGGRRLAPIVGGLYYVALPLIAAQFLRPDPLGMFVIGYILLSVWAVDIFAMFSGKRLVGLNWHRLFHLKKHGPVCLAAWSARRLLPVCPS